MITIGPYGATSVVWLKSCVHLKGKIGLVCWQLLHGVHAMDIL